MTKYWNFIISLLITVLGVFIFSHESVFAQAGLGETCLTRSCNPGLYCVNNLCSATPGALNQACRSNTDCKSNLCVNNTCKLRIGSACTSNNQCGSGDCEDSFCDCSDTYPSRQCASEYGRTNNIDVEQSNWRCLEEDQDPDKTRAFLDFCVNTNFAGQYPVVSNDSVKYPLERKKLMGEPCDDADACFSGSCDETTLPSTESNDPWYVSGEKVRVCTAGINAAVATGIIIQDICTQQYGNGTWTRAEGSGELSGIYVCKSSAGWTPATLQEMRKYSPPNDSNDTGVTTSIFGVNVTIKPVDLVQPAPRIGIPGVVFSNISKESHITTDESGTSWLNIPFLGEYISGIYKYSVGLISLIAVLVLIVSGVQIITSAGNSEVVSGAKNRIISAIIAIAISAGSYTILYTINPELVNLRNLKILTVPGITLETPEEHDEIIKNTPVDSQGNVINTITNINGTITGADGPVTKIPSSVNELTEKEFKKDTINDKKVNGWNIWNELNETQKNEIIPHLFIKTGTCLTNNLVKTNIDICGWKNKLIHKDVLPFFDRAMQNAQKYGFLLCPGSTYRDLDEETQLWNTGIVARFKEGVKEWKTNQGKIAKPSCVAPHSSGGSVDVALRPIGSKDNVTNFSGQMNSFEEGQAYYSNINNPNVYATILEQIMYESGWVRYCQEKWHFETQITLRFSKWSNPQARCVSGPNSRWANWVITIPDTVKRKANTLTTVPIYPGL